MERDQASKFVNDLLRLMISRNGSDLFLTADFPPAIKVDGRVTKVSPQPLTGQHTMALARAVMNDKQAAEFEKTKDGAGRVAAHEIMLGTAAIRNLIRENKVAQMYSSIQTGNNIGMQTLDQNLADLVRRNIVSPAEARGKAKFPENFPG